MPPTAGAPGQQQQYQGYHQAGPPQGYYQPYPPPPAKSSGTPGWMLVGLGVALAVGGMKVMEFLGGKKGDMQSMMMQQMMKQAMKQAGGPGAPGGMPGMPPMGGGMPGMPPTPGGAAGFPPFPSTPTPPPTPKPAAASAATATVDVPAAEPAKKSDAPETSDAKTSASASEEKKDAAPAMPGSGSFFSDATDDAGPSKEAPAPNPFETMASESASGSGSASASSPTVEGEPVQSPEDEEAELAYMQEMLRNPQMQEMMYPYLPEMMRNPETFEMLLSNPMYKDQLRDIMRQMKAGGGADGAPGMGMPDVNSPEVQEQFAAMGMTPQDAISKLMGDPELAMAFQNPKIQQAVMDCSSNPNNIMKYQNDPEIMQVFMKLATMFPGAAGAGAGMGGMPPQQ